MPIPIQPPPNWNGLSYDQSLNYLRGASPPPGGTTIAGNPTSDGFISDSHIDGALLNEQLTAFGGKARFGVNQAIESRGGLRFNFAPTNSNVNTRVRWLPFYENPNIVESRKATYANTKIFLRNEPVRLYTGSDARKFKVDINYSLIHIAQMMPTTNLFSLFNTKDKMFNGVEIQMVKDYLLDVMLRDTGSAKPGTREDWESNRSEFENRSTVEDGPFGSLPSDSDSAWNHLFMFVMRSQSRWAEISTILQYAINIIRSSVISTAQQPVKGPPIVELKWGALYDFTPCIITDYRIQPVENAGYDTKSLFPQRIKISLSLEEMRNIHGNLWGDPQISSNLPGWDTILNLGSMDPLNEDDARTQVRSFGRQRQLFDGSTRGGNH